MICSFVLRNGCSQSGFRIRNQLQNQSISIHQLTKNYSRLASTSPPILDKSSHSSIHFLNQLQSQSYTRRSFNHSSIILSNQSKASSSSDPKAKSISPIPTSSNQNHLTIWQRTKRSSRPYMALSRIDKPIGTWLLFWPCAWSITLASHALQAAPSVMFGNLFLFGVGALVMRGAGCTINDMWDVKVDKMVERTKARPLAAGDLTYFQALSFLGVQLSLGLGVLVNLNWYSILLGASSLTVVTIYPLMKRITYWPQLVLGLAFNWGALLGWSAIAGNCQWMTVLPLYFGSVCWTLVYDTIYAHQDKTDDVTAGVKSTALLFSTSTIPILSTFSTLFISNLLYSVSTISPLFPTTTSTNGSGGTVGNLLGSILTTGHPFFLLSISLASLHLYKQLSKTDLDSRESCWKTFVSNRDLGAIVWLGLVSDYLVQVGLKGLLDGMVIVG